MAKNNVLVLFGLLYSFALSTALSDPFYYDTNYDSYYNQERPYITPPRYIPEQNPQPVYAPIPEQAPIHEPVAHAVVSNAPASQYVVATQFHSQDEFGNANFGYSNESSALEESRDEYGNVVGSYSYVDATGINRHVSYVADDGGFRITSTNNLPEDTPEVAAAKALHFDALKQRGLYLY
uniref:Cuticle protein 7 n=1 Tax=Lepeophtheirus salmonis TaxID=72036 RepID=C1BUZ4_LEPSM|nr:Cuticle protein 7 [Lepeophtheirus salmonis]